MTAEPSGRVPGGPRLIVIVGPTAAGKTAAAVELAGRIGGEIVSADSMQVYRHMDVGTAKPGTEERRRTPFHLLDIADPDRQISVADWKELAQRAIADIRSRGNAPIVCGGTGLYVRALLDNWSLAGTPADPVLRERLRERLESEGSA
ncbi:MAG TPA: isopentenyl transferase family protein, partial [Chthonomonadaceae bacterium]|nr:isopentenyl transferase family protein [Chthonomonadaceae bacterium]